MTGDPLSASNNTVCRKQKQLGGLSTRQSFAASPQLSSRLALRNHNSPPLGARTPGTPEHIRVSGCAIPTAAAQRWVRVCCPDFCRQTTLPPPYTTNVRDSTFQDLEKACDRIPSLKMARVRVVRGVGEAARSGYLQVLERP